MREIATKWIDADELRSLEKEEVVDGLSITVRTSPFHLPKSVTGVFDEQRQVFSIQFHYPDSEPPSKQNSFTTDGLTIVEGKFSGRILSIEIPGDMISRIDRIELMIEEGLRKRRLSGRRINDMNQRVAEEILGESGTIRTLSGCATP